MKQIVVALALAAFGLSTGCAKPDAASPPPVAALVPQVSTSCDGESCTLTGTAGAGAVYRDSDGISEADIAPLCDHDSTGFFFLGPDEEVGFSPLSCLAAFHAWKVVGPAPPATARS